MRFSVQNTGSGNGDTPDEFLEMRIQLSGTSPAVSKVISRK